MRGKLREAAKRSADVSPVLVKKARNVIGTIPIVQATTLPVVESSSLFNNQSEPDIATLRGTCEQAILDEDERIITERDPGDSPYLVLAGSVRITVAENGRNMYSCPLGSGEAGLFLNLKRTANFAATDDDSTVLRVRRAEFLRFLCERSVAGIRVLFMIIYSLVTKLREANEELAFEPKDNIAKTTSTTFSRTTWIQVEAPDVL